MSSRLRATIPILAIVVAHQLPRADIVTDWNAKAEAIGLEKRLAPPQR
jgi:hypothetical protein